MNTNKVIKVVGMGAVILALAVGLSLYINFSQPPEPAAQGPQSYVVVLTIDSVYADKQVAVSSDETVLRMLERLDDADSSLQLTTKEFAGLGILVEGMGAYQNGTDGKYWQYFINGTLAPVGADQYVPAAGDRVEWRFIVPETQL